MMLWDHGAYNALPNHVRSLDVGAFDREGNLLSVANAEEFFLLVEHVEGAGYIRDIARLQKGRRCATLDSRGRTPCAITSSGSHTVRGPDPGLYVRKIRELLGDGECIMGVCDSYPLPTVHHRRAARGDRTALRDLALAPETPHRPDAPGTRGLPPFNILFREGTDFTVLDRSPRRVGEPADDVTALTGNYLFASLQATGRLEGPFKNVVPAVLGPGTSSGRGTRGSSRPPRHSSRSAAL